MAKRKSIKRTSPARRRVSVKSTKSSRRKRISSAFKPVPHFLAGAGYGYMRGQLNDVVSNTIASKIPAGEYADEVAFSGISYLMARYGKKVLGVDLKQIGKAGLQVEGALIGNQVSKTMPLNLNLGGMFGMTVPTTEKKAVGYNF